jgi:hypothetical protein
MKAALSSHKSGVALNTSRERVALNTSRERDLRLDFCRGLALIIIFIDHVPDDPLSSWTLRNFSFCDAAEIRPDLWCDHLLGLRIAL